MTADASPIAAAFMRHIERCNNVRLPGNYRPLICQDETIGWIAPDIMSALTHPACRSVLSVGKTQAVLSHGSALRHLSTALEGTGIFRPFEEYFDVLTPSGAVIGQIDRSLVPLLGVEASGVHLNGLVQKKNGLFLWVARRSLDKRLDPGALDHLVAGGVSAGLTPDETIIKEASEEAAIPALYSRTARCVSLLHYAMRRPEGLRRDRLYCYDLYLPENFVPHATDGEVESFYLMSIHEVFERIRITDDFKFNVNLVLIDLFLRHGFFNPQDADYLSRALYATPDPIEETRSHAG